MEPFELCSKLSRVFVPITTPFAGDEEIDYGALEFNLESYASTGVQGFSALGSNAESKCLTEEEKLRVLTIIGKRKRKGHVLMACAAYEAQRDSERFFKQAAGLGADFGRLQAPSFFAKQMTAAVLYRFFRTVADTSPIPLLIYNAPKFCGFALAPELVGRLSAHPNIVGIKNSAPGSTEAFLSFAGEKFHVLAGSVNFLFPAMMSGAVGGTTSLASVFPGLVQRLFEYGAAHDKRGGVPLHEKANRISQLVSGTYGVSGLKAAMSLAGFRGGMPRRPLLPLTDEQRDHLRSALIGEGVLDVFQDRHFG
jgi:4-hydroxy-2-oxoglutarate aldolase